jgi:hypothetical protein
VDSGSFFELIFSGKRRTRICSDEDDVGLLAYHVPVGVLIFFLAYLTVALSFGLHFEKTRA